MKKERKGKHFIKRPVYPGGPAALKAFIAKHLKYPKEALDKKIEGTVFLKYDIDYKGKVIGTHIKSSLGHGCDEEAIRLVKMLRFEVPKTRKMKVIFHKTIQIHFRLPKPKESTISYNYTTPTTGEKSDNTVPPKTSYSYTIKLNK